MIDKGEIIMKPEEVKKIPLGLFPTPLQRMSNLERELGCGPLYIKRDDLSDLGLGGNKIRKLEYLVADAIQQGCNTLLTYGGPQTNHGRLTVAAAVRNGMKSILILHGAKPDYLSGNLVLDKMMGADLYFTEGDGEEQKALAQKVMAEYGARGDKVYEIPVGGSNVLGALGYLMMIPELMKQLDEMGASAKYLVTGSGSLGTFCGLWAGAKYFRAGFEVVPISVNPQTTFREEQAAAFIRQISDAYSLGITCDPGELKLQFGRGDVSYAGVAYNADQDAAEITALTADPVLEIDVSALGCSADVYKYVTLCLKTGDAQPLDATVTVTTDTGSASGDISFGADTMFQANSCGLSDISGTVQSVSITFHTAADSVIYLDSYVFTASADAAKNAEIVRVGAANLI